MEGIEEGKELIESFLQGYKNNRAIRWGIVLKETGELVGTLGLNSLSVWNKRAEIGCDLHPHYWNKGMTTEAVEEVLRYAFNELKLDRIGAITYPQNETSIKLLKRIGFQREGVLRGYLYQNRQSHDAFVFSLLRTEWVD